MKKPVNPAISTATLTRTILSLLNEILDILVHGQMAVCKYSKCEFVVYTLKDMEVIENKFDHSFWEVLYAKLKTFYIDNVTHVLKR